jgi:hypothetical protein
MAFSIGLGATGEYVLPAGIVPFPRGFAFGRDGRLFLGSGIGPNGRPHDIPFRQRSLTEQQMNGSIKSGQAGYFETEHSEQIVREVVLRGLLFSLNSVSAKRLSASSD